MSGSNSDGWCPFATPYTTSKYWSGNKGRRAVVMHIAQGSYEAAVNWLSNDQSNPNSSAHFVIAKDGRIAQLVSVFDSAWANGLRWINGQWYTPADPARQENPPWVDIVAGVNPNLYTISVEHEGFYQEKWTPEMYAANTRLLKWIATVFPNGDGSPMRYTPHRNLIGHYEIDPIDRANCPGPNVNYDQIAADANGSGLVSQVIPISADQHIYGTTPLVALPGYTIVKSLTETGVSISGYLDYEGTRWYISKYSYQNGISNFFDSDSTIKPIRDLAPSLSFNPGYRDAVVPGADELKQLSPRWVRSLLTAQYQNFQTGQNSELDWLLARGAGLNIQVLVLINTETLNALPPPHGSSDWGDASSGYIGRVADLAKKIAGLYRDRIGAIEIFNEPDSQGIQPEDYAALLRAAYSAVKGAADMPVITGGLLGAENYEYLRRMVGAARGYYDGVGWHPYGLRVDGFPNPAFGFGELRNSVSSARAIGGKQVWVTEIGARLDWTYGNGQDPPEAVADYLTRAFDLMRILGRDTVAEAFWFTWKIAGESWGLVDDAGNRRPAWDAFRKESLSSDHPPVPPAVGAFALTPATLTSGDLLNVAITVENKSAVTLATQGPGPGFIYDEGETFLSRGLPEVQGAFRVGVDYDGRTGIDHPYRWGLGAPLGPGATTVVTGQIRLKNLGAKNYWAGLVQEYVAWLQDNVDRQTITVQAKPPPPVGSQPMITAVTITPPTLSPGGTLNVTITVRNDTGSTLGAQGPNPGFVYEEGQTFFTSGFPEQNGAYRVGIDYDGRTGIDHPYRWGLGAPLAPGKTASVNGAVKLSSPRTANYWAGLVHERISWLQDHQGIQAVTVKGNPPPVIGQPVIASVQFYPTDFDQGYLLEVVITVRNDSSARLNSQGPQPGFLYVEGESFLTRSYPSANGMWRVALDYEGRTGVDHPYRWGLPATLMPGQTARINGYVKLTRKQKTNFWAGLVQEGIAWAQDQVGTSLIVVEQV